MATSEKLLPYRVCTLPGLHVYISWSNRIARTDMQRTEAFDRMHTQNIISAKCFKSHVCANLACLFQRLLEGGSVQTFPYKLYHR